MTAHNAIIDDAQLRRLVAQGMGRKQIARHFRCSPITVLAHLRALRLTTVRDAEGRQPAAHHIPKVSMPRHSGPVSLPAISMFIRAREEARS